jgi:hypothetical protein
MGWSGEPHNPAVVFQEKNDGTFWIGDWVDTTTSLDGIKEESLPSDGINKYVKWNDT